MFRTQSRTLGSSPRATETETETETQKIVVLVLDTRTLTRPGTCSRLDRLTEPESFHA